MICAVVLAAGLSRRMGTQKLLLPFGGKSVITHIVDQLLASSIDKVYVVTGHQAESITRELSGKKVTIVNNTNYKSGMLSSVRCGLQNLPEKCQAVMVVLGDQPSITTEVIDLMLECFKKAEKRIFVPLYKGKRGHPILLSLQYRYEILTNYDDVGLRGVLHNNPDDIHELVVNNAAILSDMDYPEDYKKQLGLNELK